jgi:hypothetical protein
VTGFTDNCLRRFKAALAMFGTPDLLEQLRFGVRQGISLFIDGEGQSAAVIAGWQVGSLRRGFFKNREAGPVRTKLTVTCFSEYAPGAGMRTGVNGEGS